MIPAMSIPRSFRSDAVDDIVNDEEGKLSHKRNCQRSRQTYHEADRGGNWDPRGMGGRMSVAEAYYGDYRGGGSNSTQKQGQAKPECAEAASAAA